MYSLAFQCRGQSINLRSPVPAQNYVISLREPVNASAII